MVAVSGSMKLMLKKHKQVLKEQVFFFFGGGGWGDMGKQNQSYIPAANGCKENPELTHNLHGSFDPKS